MQARLYSSASVARLWPPSRVRTVNIFSWQSSTDTSYKLRLCIFTITLWS